MACQGYGAVFLYTLIKKQWEPNPTSSIVKSPQPTIKQDRHPHCLWKEYHWAAFLASSFIMLMLLHVSSVYTFTICFTWRILLCTKKFLIRLDLLRINGISRIPRFMHTVPVLLFFEPHSQGYRCINNWRCWYIPNWKETFRDFTRNIQSLPFRNPLLLQKSIEDELGWWWHTSYEKGQKVTNGAYKSRNISYSWCYTKSEA